MSEAEVVELIYANLDVMALNVMSVSAIVFAYLVCAYLVGKKLTGTWAFAISLSFSLFIVSMMAGSFNRYSHIVSLSNFYKNKFPEGPLIAEFAVYIDGSMIVLALILSPIVVGWLGSLLYMHLFIRNGRSA